VIVWILMDICFFLPFPILWYEIQTYTTSTYLFHTIMYKLFRHPNVKMWVRWTWLL